MAEVESTNSNRKEIKAALNRAGLDRIDKNVLSKCAALASTLHVSPDEMATCWEAFSLNKSAGELTMHNFEAYKNEVYKHSEIRPPVTTSSEGAIQTRRVKREPTTNMVTPPAPKRHQRTAGPSPVSSIDNIAKANAGVSSSPARRALATPLPKYEERPKAGQVVLTYNPKEFPPMKHSAPVEKFRCVVSAKDFEESNTNSSYRHMFTTIEDRAEALENRLTTMGKRLIERHGISDGSNGIAPLEQLNVPRQDTICCVGRICNEAHEGKLNATSVVLEGSSSSCGGARINVDLSHLKSSKTSYSLFPGQIVAVEGMNPTGRKLVAHRICEGAADTPLKSSIGQFRTHHEILEDDSPLKIMTASGPFTTSDNITYQPLIDLANVIMDHSPDVVILTGPFVDVKHESVKSGNTVVEFEDGEQTVSHEAFFAYKVTSLIEELFEDRQDANTQFILVPSLDDATAKAVYPQPPFEDRDAELIQIPGAPDMPTSGINRVNAGRKVPRIRCLSNPCTFKINEVVFGVTSNDVLFHVSTEETNANLEPGSRLRRIAQHMLQQRSYYPLYPPPPSMPTNLNLKKMDSWKMPCRPDVLIVPSKLTCFANKVLDSTVVVNPGHLCRGTTGGTYGLMQVFPVKRNVLDESGADDVEIQHALQDRMQVEVKRI